MSTPPPVKSRLKTLRALFLVENLDLPRAAGVEDARWEHFQLALLNDDGMFRADLKSRQISWSFVSAADGLADAILSGRSSIYVSINQNEAKEKIRYALAIREALPPSLQPKLIRKNELAIELANGARLESLPAKPPRGKPQVNIYLDEFAHVRDDEQIYTGGLPAMAKGGRLKMGSSPLGASGVFWEVFSQQLRLYPGYTRKVTPWWLVHAFCTNVREAKKLAPNVPTAQRVDLFGNDRIKMLYANLPEEDFQQEFECLFIDETTSWITWDELKRVQDAELRCELATGRGTALAAAYDAINNVQALIATGQIEPVLAGGMDVGRTRNTTELWFVGLNMLGSFPLRLAITLDNVEFDDQLAVLVYALRTLPVTTLLIDRNGIGRNLAENAEHLFPSKAAGVDFTNASKTLWATDAKMLIQQHRTPLPVDRDIAYQIHSIKKMVSGSRNLVFDTARNEKHHADKFWAWALAINAAVSPLPPPDETIIYDDPVHISPY